MAASKSHENNKPSKCKIYNLQFLYAVIALIEVQKAGVSGVHAKNIAEKYGWNRIYTLKIMGNLACAGLIRSVVGSAYYSAGKQITLFDIYKFIQGQPKDILPEYLYTMPKELQPIFARPLEKFIAELMNTIIVDGKDPVAGRQG